MNGQFVQYGQFAQQGLGGFVLNAKAGISAAHRLVMLAICKFGGALQRCGAWLALQVRWLDSESLASDTSGHMAQVLCNTILYAALASSPCRKI